MAPGLAGHRYPGEGNVLCRSHTGRNVGQRRMNGGAAREGGQMHGELQAEEPVSLCVLAAVSPKAVFDGKT